MSGDGRDAGALIVAAYVVFASLLLATAGPGPVDPRLAIPPAVVVAAPFTLRLAPGRRGRRR